MIFDQMDHLGVMQTVLLVSAKSLVAFIAQFGHM